MVKANGVLFCGGGTGGHVLPGLAVAAACRALGQQDLRWIGDPARLEARLVPAAQIPLLPMGLDRPHPRSLRWWLRAGRTFFRVWQHLQKRPPQVVVALGGYAALLPGILAPMLRRPLVVLEQNAYAGRTNRNLARFARAVITQFPEAERHLPRARCHRLGNPLRSFTPQARGHLQTFTVLVMGGSLAAQSLNDALLAAAPHLATLPGLRLIHLAGEADRERCQAAYDAAGLTAEVWGFCQDMAAVYARADLALGRSGATTVAECCACGLGAIYVPLPWAAEDHQTANARAVARAGGAVLLPQAQCTPAALIHLLTRFHGDRSLVARLGQRALGLAKPQAAQAVASLVADLARGR